MPRRLRRTGHHRCHRPPARLRISELHVKALSYNASGAPTYAPTNRTELTDLRGCRAFYRYALTGSFETTVRSR